MALEITGTLIKILPIVGGQGQKGPWQKQEFVLETLDPNYPKKVCFTAWGDKVQELASFQIDDVIKATFSAESREYNDRWYTELRAFRIEQGETVTPKTPAAPSRNAYPSTPEPRERQPITQFSEEDTSDLPF